MTYARTNLGEFSTANKIYAGATVSIYTVSGGEPTETLATLYAAISGSTELANPQTLDAYGKLAQPVYIDEPVIATVTGFGNAPSHNTGVIAPVPVLTGSGSPEGAVTATVGTIYLRTNGGTDTTLYVKESGSSNTGWAAI